MVRAVGEIRRWKGRIDGNYRSQDIILMFSGWQKGLG